VIHSFLFYVCVVHIPVFVQNSVCEEKSGEDSEPWHDVMFQKELPVRIFVSTFICKTHGNY